MTPRSTALHASAMAFILLPFLIRAQNLPAELYFSPDGRMLHTGGQPSAGLYKKEIIRTVDLYFSQPNYWQQLLQNYQPKIDLPATMVVDGITYDSVGVRFKGQTSYSQVPAGSQKRSFNITVDHVDPDQNLMGYETLNLNNAFQDASFLREVVFLDLIRDHIPAAKAGFVHLNINGENWGLYPNVQQLNNEFIKEWFFSNNGTLWRADKPPGTPGGGGPQWGDGTAALNYLGPDTAAYQLHYTLKRTGQVDPWEELVTTCHRLNTLPPDMLMDSLPLYLDVDRVLWFLASEIAFGDDDSYVHKGKMDYYLYRDQVTGRMTPLEFDANTVMKNNTVNWSAFYNETNANYPLLNRLLAVPEWRQRYLAHMRTIISEKMQDSSFNALLTSWSTLIDAEVQADPKKLYSYTAFQNELTILQNFITNRRNNLLANVEVAQPAPVITGVTQHVNGVEWSRPTAQEEAQIRCTVTSANGISAVYLYHGTGLQGNFSKIQMYDDGLHNDGQAGDGIYGATLPAAPAMTWVRWYVEAMAANAAASVSYDPPGAEHDIYIHQVDHEMMADAPVRINELMALNTNTVVDEALQHDDWIELHNNSNEAFDLSGHYLTDNGSNLVKYEFPAGTMIQPGGYLIIWADNEPDQGWDHASFALSASGESVWLSDPQGVVLDHVEFGQQVANMGYARVPNGTGPFTIQAPTFSMNNELALGGISTEDRPQLLLYPNPASQHFMLMTTVPQQVVVSDATGRTIWSGTADPATVINVGHWAPGSYYVRHGIATSRLVVIH